MEGKSIKTSNAELDREERLFVVLLRLLLLRERIVVTVRRARRLVDKSCSLLAVSGAYAESEPSPRQYRKELTGGYPSCRTYRYRLRDLQANWRVVNVDRPRGS